VSAFVASLGLPEIVGAVMMIALNAYVLMGGADFGGGIWDLLAGGPRREAQRALIRDSIAPIWEANHVWLIIVVVMLFTAFPSVFATLGTILHIPLTLMLVGIVLRGSAFVFRSYGSRERAAQQRWGRVFAMSSVITPILLGVIVGAIASGAVGDAQAKLAAATVVTAPPLASGAADASQLGSGAVVAPPLASGAVAAPPRLASGAVGFAELFVAPWFGFFPLAIGLLALALFAFLAAVYLTVAARDDALREDFRTRALAAAAVAFVAAAAALVVAHIHAPSVGRGLVETPLALLLQAATATAAITAIGALWSRHWQLARIAAAAQVSLVLWGWVLVQYPYLIPPAATLRAAAAPRATLELLLAALAIGAVVLVPCLIYLFRTFAGAEMNDARRRDAW
jgi:cytochrome bd ubiquinol oxidase subunit II